MPRRTKIVATIGPASEAPATLDAMLDAGMDVARLALAHGEVDEHLDRLARVQAAAARAGRPIGILADLPGPKVRAAELPDGGVFLAEGDRVAVAPARDGDRSDGRRLLVEQEGLLDRLHPDDPVVLGDGSVTLRVESVEGDRAVAEVVSGGRLQGRPGVTLPRDRRAVATPTARDLELLEALGPYVDLVAVSFVRSADDLATVRRAAGRDGPLVVAKIETRAAAEALDAVIAAADGVMVARGDLGVRLPLEEVPHLQKQIIRTCVAFGRPVITATQMLESMVNAPTPTRAEVSDVANAVFDGTDAVMLSAETAIGHDPAAAVATMARIATRAEVEADYVQWGGRLGKLQVSGEAPADDRTRITAAVTSAAWRAALEVDARAVICATRSGWTARAMARFRPEAPLLGISPSARTARQLTVTWGVTPVAAGEHGTTDDIVWFSVETAVTQGFAAPGDVVVVLAGSPDDPEPVTDVMRVVRVR